MSSHQNPSSSSGGRNDPNAATPGPNRNFDSVMNRLNIKTPIERHHLEQHHDDESSSTSSGAEQAHNHHKFITDESLGDILQQEPSSVELMAKSSLFIEKQQQQYIQQLKQEIQSREGDLDEARTQAKRKESELEDRLLELQHRHDLEVMKLKSQAKLNEKRYHDIFKKTGATIETLKEKILQLEKNKPIFDRQLDDIKRTLSTPDLLVTENVYLDIKKAPLNQVSLKEFVQQKIYEYVAPLKSELMSTKKERDLLDENFKHTTANYEKLQREHQHVLRLKQESQTDLERQVSELEKANARLSSELQDKIRFFEEYKAKEAMYDDTKSQATHYREEADRMQRKLEEAESKLKFSHQEEEQLQKKLSTVTQQFELSQQDKSYLSKQNEDLNERILRLEKEFDYKQEKYREVKKQKKELYDKLLDIKQTSKTEYERQLQQEIDRLRAQTDTDLERIRNNAKDAFDRENRILRDTKEHAEREAQKMRSELSEVKESYQQLLMEHRNLSSKSERQMTELQSQIKLKTFEAERVSAQLLESSTNLNKARSEMDVLHKKLDLVRDEYYNLQAENSKKIIQLEADLRSTREKLQQYENMEDALNEGLDELGTATSDLTPEQEQLQVENLKRIPSSHAKRLQYCLLVVRKLNQSEKRIESLQHALQQKNSEVLTYQKKAENLRLRLENSAKPSHYLVDSIDERDRTIEQLQKQLDKQENRTKKMKSEIARLKKRKQALEKDVEKLLERVQFSNKLRRMLKERASRGEDDLENIPPDFLLSEPRKRSKQTTSESADESQNDGGIVFTK